MRYTKLGQSKYHTELDPKYAQIIFKGKMEIFDIKKTLKDCIHQICVTFFCSVVNEDFPNIFNCKI